MTFADLVTGDRVFVDANPLIHLFEPHPHLGPFCQQLIQRIDNQDLLGFSSSHVVSEVCHRLMTIEANRALGWPIPGIGNRLRTNPREVQRLSLFRRGRGTDRAKSSSHPHRYPAHAGRRRDAVPAMGPAHQ